MPKLTKIKNILRRYWVAIVLVLFITIVFYNSFFKDSSYSSFIDGARLNPFTGSLVIQIDENNYHYCSFQLSNWYKYKKAESKGKFYNSVIKGNYSCSKEVEWVFDHIIPLGLGGGDFGTTSFSSLVSEDYGVSDELATNCFAKMVQEERDILLDFGFERLSDGSWVDLEDNYPSHELETEMELYLSKSFQECIE